MFLLECYKMKNNILLLGSTGFLGTNFIQLFKPGIEETLFTPSRSELNLENISELNDYLKENEINTIINCAAFVGGISFGYRYQADLLYKNTLMTNNIYNSSVMNNVNKIINPISNCAYPENIVTYKEEDFWNGKPHDSVFYYALAKRHIIALSSAFKTQYNLSSVNVVLSNMYGPNDHFEESRSHALGALIKKIYNAHIKNEPSVLIWGTGKPIREWLFVEDGARSLIRSINLETDVPFFNIGINKGISVIDLAELIAKYINYSGEFQLDFSKPDGVPEKTVDGSLGAEILNWSPEVDLNRGIKKTVDWYIKKNG